MVAITGASGVIYGVEMLRALKALGQATHLILSEAAGLNMAIETEYSHRRGEGAGRLWSIPTRTSGRRSRAGRFAPAA